MSIRSSNTGMKVGGQTRDLRPGADLSGINRSAKLIRPLRETHGSQLLEFALALPFLVVVSVGIMDFSQAYNTKHILTNAAREGARHVASTPLSDFNCNDSTPCSIEAAADAVQYYLTSNGLNLASCINPKSPSSSTASSWTYSCNSVSLVINKAFLISGGAGGTTVPSTQVTLNYPYTFTFGRVVGLLAPGATGLSGRQTLSANSTMQTLVFD